MPDLFDFFKENESKLHELPSEQTWKKLEKKLAKRKRARRNGIRFLQIGSVVLALILLLMAAFLVYYFVKNDAR